MGMCKKLYLALTAPTEEDPRDGRQRMLDALPEELGQIRVSFEALRALPDACVKGGWGITVTLSWNGQCWEVTYVEPGDTSWRNYGLAVDLGSTTVSMRLVDVDHDTVVAQETAYNRQIAFGEDILTRVFATKDRPEQREAIRQATLETFRELMDRLTERTGFPTERCGAMTVAGNTTMMHFFLGLDGFAVFASPYAPWAAAFDLYPARQLGLNMAGYVFCYPCRANYLGGDIISGMVATELYRREEISVFLDIGTNGELVVGNRHFLLAGAGAAGPALEGGVVKTGMRAVEGAVSYVKLEKGVFRCTVIGGGAPKGICGSGIVDLIAQLFLAGILDLRGKFDPSAPGVESVDGELGIAYAPGLYFLQSDVEAFLQTKAAANTMVEYLLDKVGMTLDQVDRFYVAGAFGTHLNVESAVTIGLYPDLPREKLLSPGNSSLEGAQVALCHREVLEALPEILGNMEYVQFGEVSNFVDRMTAAKAIPHTNLSLYPTVQKALLDRGLLRR